MNGSEIVKKIHINIGDEISSIEKVEGIYEGSDQLDGLIITMDDPVKTQLRVEVYKGKFRATLSQMEPVPTRKTYMDSTIPF